MSEKWSVEIKRMMEKLRERKKDKLLAKRHPQIKRKNCKEGKEEIKRGRHLNEQKRRSTAKEDVDANMTEQTINDGQRDY